MFYFFIYVFLNMWKQFSPLSLGTGGRTNIYALFILFHAQNRYLESNKPLWAKLSPDSRKKYRRPILIFHCEFSAQRAPTMYDNFRRADRLSNQYPHLHYPEMYILEKGYCNFHKNTKKAVSDFT